MGPDQLYGLGCGVMAAFAWAVSSIFWAKIQLPAFSLTLHKNLIGTALLLVHLLMMAAFYQTPVFTASAKSWSVLAASGVIGIVIGDTCYFKSLQILGPSRSLMVSIVAPFFTAVIGWAIGIESLSLLAYLGIGLTFGGIAVVLNDKQADDKFVPLSSGSIAFGVAAGVFGAVCQAVGGVLSDIGANGVGSVEAALIRIACSALLMVVLVGGQKKISRAVMQLRDFNLLPNLFIASAIGTWIGIWLSMLAFKYCSVSVAQTSLALCPLFALPVAFLAYGQRASLIAIFGVVVSVAGVYLTATGTTGSKGKVPQKQEQVVGQESEVGDPHRVQLEGEL